MPTLSHMLWFDCHAEEAANFYTGIFAGKVHNVARGADGKAFTVNFEILGSQYIALNGGPQFTFNESFSIFITVDGQEEVDQYWNALTVDGGEEGRCGWLKDKFGLSWQIVPKQLGEYLGNSDPAVATFAMQAMMNMSKIVISDLVESK